MDGKTFKDFRNLIYDKSGISLSDGKEALVCARVGKRMRALGMTDHRAYLKHIMRDDTGQEVICLLDSISTNVTRFFREGDHFEFLEQVIKEWNEKGQKRFRIWSAASSSGEEPYSIAMTILEAIGEAKDTRILATDISTRVLTEAQRGIYRSEKLDQVSDTLKNRYFEKIHDSDGKSYAVRPELKSIITYRRLNLSTPPFPMRGPLDIVFCRNVMIYFDNRVRYRLLTEIHRLLKPSGYLAVGHAESLIGFTEGFKSVQPSVYVKIG